MSAEGSRTPPEERTVTVQQDPSTYRIAVAAGPPGATLAEPAIPPPSASIDIAIEAAITAAYLEHRGVILGYTLRMTRDPEVAEDIVHEAYLRLLGVARAGFLPDNIAGWLHRVARNLVIDWTRRSHRTWAAAGSDDRQQMDDGPEEIVLDLERDTALHEALARLPDDARRALLLSGAGYPSADIATMIGRTDGATRTLLCRARQRTRVLLTAGGNWSPSVG
jgi:RNA polymerase sigma-70 factor, ECF subfamily